jgi:hypothetical protein
MIHPGAAPTFQAVQHPFCLMHGGIVKMKRERSLRCLRTVGVTELRQWIKNIMNEGQTAHFLTLRQKISKRMSNSCGEDGDYVLSESVRSVDIANVTQRRNLYHFLLIGVKISTTHRPYIGNDNWTSGISPERGAPVSPDQLGRLFVIESTCEAFIGIDGISSPGNP